MRFDFISFLIGMAVAGAIAFVLYRSRGRILAMRKAAETGAGSTRKFITNSSESRYYNDLVKMLNAYHLAGDAADLASLYVEPRFIRGVEIVDPDAEKSQNVFSVIPMIHDIPSSYAPYNIETLTIHELKAGDPHLALLGASGSGKSTALAIIGLVASGEIVLETIDLNSDAIFEDETKDLPREEKEKLIKQRHETQQRAIEHLKQAQEKQGEEASTARKTHDFERMLPILVHLRDIDLRPDAFGVQTVGSTSTNGADGKAAKSAKAGTKTLDPAEPLVKALQNRFSAVTASTLPRMIYNRLAQGTCLLLIDGYEDIPTDERPVKLLWLKQLMSVYGHRGNFIVVTGPATGYDPLLNLGFTPIYLRAWSDLNYEELISRWAASWPTIAGTPRKPAPMPEERIVRRVSAGNRGRVPFDVTLKIWAAFAGDEQEVGRRGWYDYYVRQAISSKETRHLGELAAADILNQQGKPITRERMKELAASLLATGDGKSTGSADDMIGKLINQSGLLVDWPGNFYSFRHQLMNAYLASETLQQTDTAAISAAVASPMWDAAMPFVAITLPLTEAVAQRLGSAPDLLYSGLFSLVPWLPDAPPNAAWRAELFKRLTAALLAPSQYPAIRERAMAALVASRDKNVMFIFRQALRSTDPVVRRLGCVGIGALGETDGIKDLGAMLGDGDAKVQLAAALALGAIGTEAALETMLGGFVEGEQDLRQAVAEALAAVPGEGHAVLRDAMSSQDMMVRRAAVFGLARIPSAWALSLLYRALLEDEQWYVRNAAEQAFLAAEGLETLGAVHQPEADTLTWLVAWAASKGEGVPAGPNARQALIRVLQEGEPPLRAAAARTLANMGYMPALKPLYGALRDKDETVRAAVYESLGMLQTRVGEKLPAIG